MSYDKVRRRLIKPLAMVAILLCIAYLQVVPEKHPWEATKQTEHSDAGDNNSKNPKYAASIVLPPSKKNKTIIIQLPPSEETEHATSCPQGNNTTGVLFYWWCNIRNFNSEQWIAVFTVLLGISTTYLYFATRDLVGSAERTAQKQLRAYVHAVPSGNIVVSRIIPQVGIVVENTGQTPAYNLRFYATIMPLPYPLVEKLPINPLPPDGILSKVSLHPRGKLPSDVILDGEWNKKIFDLINTPNSSTRLYLFGEIIYNDIYGIERKTLFRLVSVINKITLKHELIYCEEGNEAD